MRKIVVVWLVMLMVVGGMVGFASMSINTSKASSETVSSSLSQSKSYTAHAPIYIDGNSQFTSENGVTGGSGTESDPYIIENWDISASSATGISIRNTNVYFIIRNCVICDGRSNYHVGIHFYDIINGKLENCSIYNNDYGIWLDDSSNNNITSNNIYNNEGDGIFLEDSSNNNIITSNNIYNDWNGIRFSYSSNNNISSNNIHNNKDNGIRLSSSPNNNITSNNIHNNDHNGVSLCDSSNNNIIENNFTNDAIALSGDRLGHYVQDIKNNTVNGKQLYYFLDQNDVLIDGWEIGQLLLVNCTGFTIKNVNISYTDVGIEMAFSSNNNISTSRIYNNYYGIYLSHSSNNNITSNNIYNNSLYGIRLWDSSNNNIIANNIYNNRYGLSLYYSSNNNMTSNNIHNNDYIGICLSSSSSNNNIIIENNIYNNGNGVSLPSSSNNNIIENNIYNNRVGICLSSSNNNITANNIYNNGIGIDIFSSSNNSISANQIYDNRQYGIELCSSSNNTITNCAVYNNSWTGIWLYYFSNNNFIYHNNFINNTQNANDACTNFWDNGNVGNYWSDYSGIDPDEDGIGNIPYNISGGNNQDRYPLMHSIDNAGCILNISPIALFTYSPDSPTPEDIIQFTDLSFDISGDIVSWLWDFGDGNVSTEQNPQHKYSVAGNYTVKLTVTDNNDLNATYTRLITVKEEEAITNGGTTNGEQPSGSENKQGINLNYVIGIVVIAACVILGLVLVKRRGKQSVKVKEKEKPTLTLRCPKCRQTFKVEVKPKPFNVKCPHCGKEGVIK